MPENSVCELCGDFAFTRTIIVKEDDGGCGYMCLCSACIDFGTDLIGRPPLFKRSYNPGGY